MNGYLAADLGSTNLKAVSYDENLTPLKTQSIPVSYQRSGELVEFDAAALFDGLLQALKSCAEAFPKACGHVTLILTGQAESLVLARGDGVPLRPAISWMDGRGGEEADALRRAFPEKEGYRVTGQPSINTSWPAVNLLWLRAHEPEAFVKADYYFLLKDYMIFRLTGKAVTEYSCACFSYYFDCGKRRYWPEMLSFCGIDAKKLPALTPPCTVIGELLPEIAEILSLSPNSTVNCGALDHFCGMIGVGNIAEGLISESTGTVLTVASMAASFPAADTSLQIPCHCGPFPDSYVFLSVCESGGDALEWYRAAFLPEFSFQELDARLKSRKPPEGLLFLPYLQGVSAPEYDPNAQGVFYGVSREHDRLDFAYAVMEGLAHLLRKNIEAFPQKAGVPSRLLSTGGGAKSAFWCQLKADVCSIPVDVPVNYEAACFGAAIAGAVAGGRFSSFADAVSSRVGISKSFPPALVPLADYAARHRLFCSVYNRLFKH